MDFPIGGRAMADYLHESATTIYRRRRHRRTVFTMGVVGVLLSGTVVYGLSYVKGWLPGSNPTSLANANCSTTKFKPLLTPRDVTINVYNATPTAGLASKVARTLEKRGFSVGAVDNDPLGRTVLSPGEIRHGPSGAIPAVIAATMLPGASSVTDDRTDRTVDLVLGKTFNKNRLRIPPAGARYRTAQLARLSTPKSCSRQVNTPKGVGHRQVSAGIR